MASADHLTTGSIDLGWSAGSKRGNTIALYHPFISAESTCDIHLERYPAGVHLVGLSNVGCHL